MFCENESFNMAICNLFLIFSCISCSSLFQSRLAIPCLQILFSSANICYNTAKLHINYQIRVFLKIIIEYFKNN